MFVSRFLTSSRFRQWALYSFNARIAVLDREILELQSELERRVKKASLSLGRRSLAELAQTAYFQHVQLALNLRFDLKGRSDDELAEGLEHALAARRVAKRQGATA